MVDSAHVYGFLTSALNWDPFTDPGLLHYWNANDSVNTGVGTPVTSLPDNVGTATLTPTGTGPTFTDNYYGTGNGGMDFDGTMELAGTIPALPPTFTIVVVADVANGLGGQGLLTADGTVSGPPGFILDKQADNTFAFWGFTAGDAPGNAATPSIAHTAPLYVLRRTATTVEGWNPDQTHAVQPLAAGSSRVNVGLQVGTDPGLPSLNGNIGLILIFGYALPDALINRLYAIFNPIYGPPF